MRYDLKRAKKVNEVALLLRGEFFGDLVLEFLENLFERSGSIVVEIRSSLTDAAKTGRIEFAISVFIFESDIVEFGRCIKRGLVTSHAILLFEDCLSSGE